MSGDVCGSPLLFPHGWSGSPCRRETDHAYLVWTRLWPAVAAVPDSCPAARHTSCHVRGGCRKDHPCPRWWPACGRRPDTGPGQRSPQTPACQPGRTPAVRTAVVPEAADGQSADRSGSLQLPLLFLKAGPAGGRLRRPSSRRQRHDGHRASSLTLPPSCSKATRVWHVTRTGGCSGSSPNPGHPLSLPPILEDYAACGRQPPS
jgi:hypothetical protein